MSSTLVLGPAAGGRSHHALSLLSGTPQVTWVCPPEPAGQAGVEPAPEVAQPLTTNVPAPSTWIRVETTDLARALIQSRHPVLIDDLETWVGAVLDSTQGWEDPETATALVHDLVDQFQVALMAVPVDVVVLGRDPGLLAAATAPGEQLLHDLLGAVVRRVGATCSRVELVVAGRLLDLGSSLRVQGAALR
ncbi:bifunctional adenosylcobinamide kinase/adenosylcobinamide-phosphate guanylyltransferase [Ornithinicoccus hortensis]|uniref:Adenosylcobinamide kinase n=1 Tax=Ornithinicoccus hortensis TaxID=82346 RepID=A0A542YR97_9MICO|nr:bifunctional adenosylcobinamide kinase/adenosylcobinamide-phosphate guanylyltransferase [Ornithinicoccus hortensis]TQL50601.1 adenosylcobinamide kinase /adenosylcobinamide-phosphate guanylyltransferase [Ornithinicoccus hortensis]